MMGLFEEILYSKSTIDTLTGYLIKREKAHALYKKGPFSTGRAPARNLKFSFDKKKKMFLLNSTSFIHRKRVPLLHKRGAGWGGGSGIHYSLKI